MRAEDICNEAASLVSGDRAKTHGDKAESFKITADLWSVYLGIPIAPHQAAQMLGLLKVARTCCGETNPDDYVDQAGYAGIAGELVE